MTKADKRESIIMIASEPLTFERNEWMEVKTNTMLVITPKVSLKPALHHPSSSSFLGLSSKLTGIDEPASNPDH